MVSAWAVLVHDKLLADGVPSDLGSTVFQATPPVLKTFLPSSLSSPPKLEAQRERDMIQIGVVVSKDQ
jgi:hypothetical protein